MARYHGKSGTILLSTSGSGTAIAAISLSEWSLDMKTQKAEVTAFGDSNLTYVQGLPDTKGALKGFWDDTADALFTAAASADGIKMYLYPAGVSVAKFWSGTAWLDMSIDTSVKNAVTVSGDFVAKGTWTKT